MGKCLFVTGTGTDIGKTYVTALMVKKLRALGKTSGYYKAALSGAERDSSGGLLPGDADYVRKVGNIGKSAVPLVSYVYPEPVSPHLAARLNQQPISMDRLNADFARARSCFDYLTVEGSGGIVCPLRWDREEKFCLDDWIRQLGLSVLMVADSGLGTINAAVLTAEHLQKIGIPLKGIIFNRFHSGSIMEKDNLRMVEEMTGIPVIARVTENATDLEIEAEELAALYE